MSQDEIRAFLDSFAPKRERTLAIVDFANLEMWQSSLGWRIGIRELAQLIAHFSAGDQQLRRFYYGSDLGPHERSPALTPRSRAILNRAELHRFEVITKPVKYIHDAAEPDGYRRKCNLDVEMVLNLVRLERVYDSVILFSGDGDFACALRYLHEMLGKRLYVFGAKSHMGKELIDAGRQGVIEALLYAEDFEYRLNMDRQSASIVAEPGRSPNEPQGSYLAER